MGLGARQNGGMEPRALAALRRSYELAGLDVADVDPDPIVQFGRWLADAVAAELMEPNALVLATADASGRPRARTVLLKGADAAGFTFFTNYDSPKSRDIEQNPHVAATFVWLDLHRQVRVRGLAARVDPAESDAYFASRPRGSQLGAWASPQSEVIADRAALDALVDRIAAEHGPDVDVPRPANWGGWRLVPHDYEFWQGRANRLHDRLRYRHGPDAWVIERLAP